jgi:hypothetical protein
MPDGEGQLNFYCEKTEQITRLVPKIELFEEVLSIENHMAPKIQRSGSEVGNIVPEGSRSIRRTKLYGSNTVS